MRALKAGQGTTEGNRFRQVKTEKARKMRKFQQDRKELKRRFFTLVRKRSPVRIWLTAPRICTQSVWTACFFGFACESCYRVNCVRLPIVQRKKDLTSRCKSRIIEIERAYQQTVCSLIAFLNNRPGLAVRAVISVCCRCYGKYRASML